MNTQAFFARDGRVYRQLGDTPVYTSPIEASRILHGLRQDASKPDYFQPEAKRLADQLAKAMEAANLEHA